MTRTAIVVSLLALAAAPLPSQAGGFFAGAGLGAADVEDGKGSPFAFDAVGGYRWEKFGVEIGHASVRGVEHDAETAAPAASGYDVDIDAWMLGGNLRHEFAPSWYLSARAGLMSWSVDGTRAACDLPPGSGCSPRSYDRDGTGWYAGLGAGYAVSERVDVGLAWRRQSLELIVPFDPGSAQADIEVDVLSFALEYRFR